MTSVKKSKIPKPMEKNPYFVGLLKPDDQLILSPPELEDFQTNALYVHESSKPNNRVVYSNKERKFIPHKDKTKFYTRIILKSSLLNRESSQAKIQTQNELCRKPESLVRDNKTGMTEVDDEQDETKLRMDTIYLNIQLDEEANQEAVHFENEMEEMNEMNEMYEMDETIEMDDDKSLSTTIKDGSKEDNEQSVVKTWSLQSILSLPIMPMCSVVKLKNHFNFFSRLTQSMAISSKDCEVQTPVIKTQQFETNVVLSDIYDAFKEDIEKQEKEKEKERRDKMAALKLRNMKKIDVKAIKEEYGIQNKNEQFCVQFLEKIINLNVNDAIAQDFRYYEDPSDQFRNRGEGTIIPLWVMSFIKEPNLFVTDISWSPDYFDYFAVTLATTSLLDDTLQTCYEKGVLGNVSLFEFGKRNALYKVAQSRQSTVDPDVGYVCLWSLKNSKYPEYVVETRSGAMCASFHPDYGHVLAIGLRDGTLAVYNVSLSTREPQFATHSNKTRHMASVRQVVWCKDFDSGELNFFSVSEDGTVCQWILMKFKLIKIVRAYLIIDSLVYNYAGGVKQNYYAMGTTITFKPGNDDIYLVGTAEGYIFKCNKKWPCLTYMQKFKAHAMPIIRIDYNKFNSDIYLTCSEDFMVKLWNDNSEVPVIVFDIYTYLSDACWSPFSSTVFVVLTSTECRIIIYDMDVSLKKSVCDQQVYSSEKYILMRMALNKRLPIILIGSSRSTIVSYKLSPNLRTIMKPPKKGIQEPIETLELRKLRQVLEAVIE